MSIIQAGVEITKGGNCRQCRHPVSSHLFQDGNPFVGCRSCDCPLDYKQAKESQAAPRANSNKAGG